MRDYVCGYAPCVIMNLLPSTHTHACVLSVCSDPCLHPGDHLKDRIQPCISESAKQRHLVSASFGTWIAKAAEWVTVGKYGAATIVYLPSQDAFYYASPASMLSAQCPDRTVFLGQFVIDNDSTPRILVYDLVRLRGVSCQDMPPRERYACLQELGNLLGSMCTLQWVGECKALSEELKAGKFKVPHEVRGVISLSHVPGKISIEN